LPPTKPECERTEPGTELDVVICTYDNPVLLDGVLDTLANQRDVGAGWSVTVVDNNSPAETRAVVERHRVGGRIPGLRRVVESEQGLTPARLRGVRCTAARWIAFVDDDCMLADTWIHSALEFARTHEDCAGFGGRVIPDYLGPPPEVVRRRYGWAFAEQDLGHEPVTVDCLVGAGMVVNRTALVESGWPNGPYFADRIGRNLVSGGDVEIALRLAATRRPLWYAPACGLRHVIPARRTETRYLRRMTFGLGVSYSLAQALVSPRSRRRWLRSTVEDLMRSAVELVRAARRAFSGSEGRIDAQLATGYELGRWVGAGRVATLLLRGRCDFFGRASS